MHSFRSWLHFQLVERVLYERQILYIKERDIKHVANDQHCTARVNNFKQANIQRFTPNSFYHCQHDVPAIEDRKGHHIYDREVHVQDHAKPEREPPTVLTSEKAIKQIADAYWPAQVLQLHVRLRRRNSANCLQCTGHAVVELFDRIRMSDRYFSGGIPLNSNARLHFTVSRQKRRSYGNVQPRTTSLHVKNELVLGMLADVFEEGDWVVDRRLVEPANDIVWSQSRRCRRRLRFHFFDDGCLRRKDEQLPNTLPAPSARFRFIRFHPNGLHIAIALEFHRTLVAFTSHHVPAHAVIHPEKTPDRFAIHFENFIARLKPDLLRRRIWHDITDDGGGIRFAHWMAD